MERRARLDIFAGSNTTGEAAQDNRRRWIAFESERKYVAGSALRFIDTTDEDEIEHFYKRLLDSNTCDVEIFKEKTPPETEVDLPLIMQLEENSS